MLKPQDIYVLLKLVVVGERPWTYADLAVALAISPSQLHAAIGRSLGAGLAIKKVERGLSHVSGKHGGSIVVHHRNLEEFLVHGVRYAFWAKPGEMTRGMVTAYAAPPLDNIIASQWSPEEPPLVWPDPEGEARGLALSPLYKQAPKAARHDQEFYQLLALVDAIRSGRARERKIAIDELLIRLNEYASSF
ncbi:MAG: hypothetical protein C0613_06340 [Desulfobulbaceae bacterium]|nr:MAG: hypothetical protein C0613_06340 [Desulfobulbaceae bacterium]